MFAAIEPEQNEKCLNIYAAEGYRLSAIAAGGDNSTLVIMSAMPPQAVTFKYKVIRSSLFTLDPLESDAKVDTRSHERRGSGRLSIGDRFGGQVFADLYAGLCAELEVLRRIPK